MRPLALAVTLACADARAATITVTDAGDAGTASTCTLRQAIVSANKNAHGTSTCVDGTNSDTIVFADALVASTITLGGTSLAVSGPLTIVGSGQTIDANHASRVLYVLSTTLTASDIALVNGSAPGQSGAGLFVASSTVYLTNVVVSGNTADNGAGIAAPTSSNIQLTNSLVAGNTAQYKGGGVQIANGSTVTLIGSVVSGNSAARGGGVFAGYTGTLAVSQSTISGNSAASASTQSGGGIYGYRCNKMSLVDTTVSGNSSTSKGGGIAAYNCPLLAVNSTVAGNTSTDSFGGGIYIQKGDASLINSTISANHAQEGGGLHLATATTTLSNTIISANSVAPAYVAGTDIGASSSIVVAQYSLLGSALSSGVLDPSSSGNVFSDTPGLGPLQDNGGPTQTMALLGGSPAIDAGSSALAKDGGTYLFSDQRLGFPRLQGSSVDIGAVEYQPDRIFATAFEGLP